MSGDTDCARTCGSCGHDHHHGYEHRDADLGHIQGLILGALLFLIVNMNMGGDGAGGGGGGGGGGAPPVRNVNIFRTMADLLLFRGKRSLAKREAYKPRVYFIREGGVQFTHVSARFVERLGSILGGSMVQKNGFVQSGAACSGA